MKRVISILSFILLQVIVFGQNGSLTITVHAGSVPLQGVTVTYTCDWNSNLGNWTSWNSGVTDANGEIITPTGTNLNNVVVEVTNVPWAIQQQYGNTFYPAQFTFASLTTNETCAFNTQQTAPDITINHPNSNPLILPLNGSTPLEADITVGGGFNITSVNFSIDGQSITNSNTSGSTYASTSNWQPTPSDFYQQHTFSVTATSSNNATTTESFDFYLDCSGVNCPNQLPTLNLISPSPTTVNQPGGFSPIDIIVSATDGDGTIQNVSIDVDGNTHTMNSIGNDQYQYSFTPSAYTTYPFTITATDNSSEANTLTNSITVINSTFIPLPDKVIVGYWHSWDNASAPFMTMNSVGNTNYNVAVYSFIETVNGDGFTPQLTVHEPAYLNGGVFDPQLLKNDIAALQAQGIPVLISIGGQNGHVELNTVAEKNTFVQGVINIIDYYGFDGLDLDFEGGSMDFGGGSLPDFSYATISNGSYPRLKNVIDAVHEIDSYYSTGFHITAAPEVFYVQVGKGTYSNTAGSFLPVIDNIRNILDYIHVQLYNTGSVVALDNQAYSQASPDFVVSMTDMLLKGFDVSTTGIHFNALNQDQVAIGLPACPSAAPAGGYLAPSGVNQALDYLTQGISFGGAYDTQGAIYPNLRGAMTWSINWDQSPTCASAYEFADNIHNYFSNCADNQAPVAQAQNLTLYLDASGNAVTTAQAVDNGSTDNVGVTQLTINQENFDCSHVGTNTITLTAMDACSNSNSANASITILDTISPVALAQNLTVVLSGSSVTITANQVDNGSSDNCGFTLSLSQSTFTSTGTYPVTFTATDASGNTNSVTVTITVTNTPDTTPPTVNTQNLTVYLDGSGTVSITPQQVDNGSTDNYGITSLTLNNSTFSCSDLGNNQVTLTASDASGNTASNSATITVLDTISPIASGQDIIVQLSGGSVIVTTTQVEVNSTDNCGIVSHALSQSVFTAPGIYTVDYSVEDASGNVGTTEIEITVENPDGITEINPTIKIYPNPANAGETVYLEGLNKINSIILYNVLGEVLNRYDYISGEKIGIEVNEPGVVLIQFVGDSGNNSILKVVIQ